MVQEDLFLSLFTSIESAEECPCGVELLVWDGADYHTDYVDIEVNYGNKYFANGTQGIAYMVLPYQEVSMNALGSEE
jgi:hypothetical protein